MHAFKGGGSIDGLELQLPRGVTSVVTIQRDGNQSHYAVDDTTGAAMFTGFNEQGRDMGKLWRQLTDTAKAEREAFEVATTARGCNSCGRTFGSPGAFALAHDGRCLPESAIESLLIDISGVWVTRGSDAAQR